MTWCADPGRDVGTLVISTAGLARDLTLRQMMLLLLLLLAPQHHST